MQERATRRLLFPRTRHLAPQTDCESRSKYKDGRTKAGQIRSKRTGRHRRKKGRGGHVCHIRRKREVEKESSRGRRNKTRKNERDGRKRELQLNHTGRTESGMRRCRKKKERRQTKEKKRSQPHQSLPRAMTAHRLNLQHRLSLFTSRCHRRPRAARRWLRRVPHPTVRPVRHRSAPPAAAKRAPRRTCTWGHPSACA